MSRLFNGNKDFLMLHLSYCFGKRERDVEVDGNNNVECALNHNTMKTIARCLTIIIPVESI